jgi:DNA gyrase inhibitor GyrI
MILIASHLGEQLEHLCQFSGGKKLAGMIQGTFGSCPDAPDITESAEVRVDYVACQFN